MFVGERTSLLSIDHNGPDQACFSSQGNNERGSRTPELMPGAPIGDAGSIAVALHNIDGVDVTGTAAQSGGIAVRLVEERIAFAEPCQGMWDAVGSYKLKTF